jgi:hypothetical protein
VGQFAFPFDDKNYKSCGNGMNNYSKQEKYQTCKDVFPHNAFHDNQSFIKVQNLIDM